MYNIDVVITEVNKQALYVKRNFEERSCNDCCSGKSIRITYSECVFVTLGIQHAMGMLPIIWSSGACPALPNFHIIS